MNKIEDKRLAIFKWVANIKDEKVIDLIFAIMQEYNQEDDQTDWWAKLTKEQQEGVKEGLRQMENGETSSDSLVQQKVQELLNKHS